MTRDQRLQLQVDDVAILDPHLAVDHRQVYADRCAENQRGQRVVLGACEFETLQAVGDEIGGHAGGQRADVVAA